MAVPLGTRILIWGNSCSGKSSLAEQLARELAVPFVDLDALNWLPDWVGLNATDPGRLERRINEATAGDAWVVAGSYTKQSQATFWPRLHTIVWLDMPMPVLLYRVIVRSWRRWRSSEHLWGTNYENFWRQLMVWKGEDSLVWWIVTRHHAKRRETLSYMADPKWAHIRFVRLTHPVEIDAAVRRLIDSELPPHPN